MYFYLIFFVTLGISLLASFRVKRMIARYSLVPASGGFTGAEAAQRILASQGIHDVDIVAANGFLGDHYDPLKKVLVLSPDNYSGTSTAAVGIAAHECGHAIQHQHAYAPLQWRMAAVGATQFAGQIVGILPFLFYFTHLVSMYVGLTVMSAAWGVIMVFNLVTLPVEFDASRRAKAILPSLGIIRGPAEVTAVNQVLDAAAWTYVAAFLTSLAYFLMYVLPLLLGGDRRR
jgi:Zn-dependent membrane protease YugP